VRWAPLGDDEVVGEVVMINLIRIREAGFGKQDAGFRECKVFLTFVFYLSLKPLGFYLFVHLYLLPKEFTI